MLNNANQVSLTNLISRPSRWNLQTRTSSDNDLNGDNGAKRRYTGVDKTVALLASQ